MPVPSTTHRDASSSNQTPPTTAPPPAGGDRSAQVHELFSRVARRYDLLNGVITMGLHHAWRRRCVRWSDARPGDRVLDLATGTGDLALEFKRAVGAAGEVVGTDFNATMLAAAPEKARAAGLDVRFEIADALALPYADGSFDVVSAAWGIRNVDDPATMLREMARVAKPGGRVMILETGRPRSRWMGPLVRLHFRVVMPALAVFAGGRHADYRYLQESSLLFPSGEDFLEVMRATEAFASVAARPILGGASWLYKGVTPRPPS